MNSYTFTLSIDMAEMTDAALDRLYEAGCNDGRVGRCNGVSFIDFEREAESLADAVESAIRDVQKAGFQVTKGVKEQTIKSWHDRR